NDLLHRLADVPIQLGDGDLRGGGRLFSVPQAVDDRDHGPSLGLVHRMTIARDVSTTQGSLGDRPVDPSGCDRPPRGRHEIPLRIVTVVPRPMVDSISNSSMS